MFHQCKIRNSYVNFNKKKKTTQEILYQNKEPKNQNTSKGKIFLYNRPSGKFFSCVSLPVLSAGSFIFFLSSVLPFSSMRVSCVYICMTQLFCSFSISFSSDTCALAVAALCIHVVCFLGSRTQPISYKL